MPLLSVTGANGFVGRHLVAAARKAGWDVRGLVRSEGAATRVREAGGDPVQVDAGREDALAHALAGAHGIVHLAQIGAERGTATYREVNVLGTRRVAAAAAQAGVRRMAYFSGLGVAHYGQRRRTTNGYFLSKLLAEAALLESGLDVTVFRPSYVLGPGDGLVAGLRADLATGELEQPGDGSYRMQPIAVSDAVAAILAALGQPAAGTRRVIDLVGPEAITYRALLGAITRVTPEGRAGTVRVREIPIPEADRQAAAGGYKGMLPDELDCLLCDEVADPGPLEALLDRTLVPLESAILTAVRGTPSAFARPGPSQ